MAICHQPPFFNPHMPITITPSERSLLETLSSGAVFHTMLGEFTELMTMFDLGLVDMFLDGQKMLTLVQITPAGLNFLESAANPT